MTDRIDRVRAPAPSVGDNLAEVWGDIVDRTQLAKAIAIGTGVSLSTYWIAGWFLAGRASTPEIGRAIAMLFGILGCVGGGIIGARLFKPKRVIVDETANAAWRIAALDQLNLERGGVGRIEDLPPVAAAEMKEVGLYDLFANHRPCTKGQQGPANPAEKDA
ncbi:hypothetical protein [Ensifer canadensis]